MTTQPISADIADGTIYYPDHSENSGDIDWQEHPVFAGVFLKHLIQGAQSNGLFSSHLVKIKPHCFLDSHCHDKQMELHEIIEGEGVCQLLDVSRAYSVGITAVIPQGTMHKVMAGEQGLTMLAKFFPALL